MTRASKERAIPTVNLMLRVPPDIHRWLGREAAKAGVSVNAYVTEWFKQQKAKP